ncbi:tryptophan-rich sensory protein [Candidatus Saccharibacteria bacterium]|nr:tryptophan-rich sensory protein [Candidatus Saccharibacteria bacterium]
MVKTKLSTFGKIWRVMLCIAVPLGGGFLISLLTMNAMDKFGAMKQPPLAPPAWLFPVAWSILYILMGIASYLIWHAGFKGKKSDKSTAKCALILYGVQLVCNFAWSPIFFNMGQYWIALAILAIMWILEIIILVKVRKLSMSAFWCLMPYLLWTTFAAYLNISIAILN